MKELLDSQSTKLETRDQEIASLKEKHASEMKVMSSGGSMDELRAQFEEQAQAAKAQASAIEDKLTNDLEQTSQTNKDLSEQLASSEVAMDKLKAALAEEQKEAKKQQKLAEDTTAQLDKMKAKMTESAQSSAANDATSRKQEELMKQVEELQVQKIPK